MLIICLLLILIPIFNLFLFSYLQTINKTQEFVPTSKYMSNLEWEKTWGGSSLEQGNGIAVDSSGNSFITGTTMSYGAGGSDVFLLKYDSSGNFRWEKTWGSSGENEANGIALDDSGNVYITGYIWNSYEGWGEVLLLKYDLAGNLLWNTTWGGSSLEQGNGIAVDSSGNSFITGTTMSYGAGGSDVFLLKYDSSGNLIWNNTWGGSDDDYGYGTALDGSGNISITGYTESYGVGESDVFLLKYDSSGILMWNTTWGGSDDDYGYGTALDDSGNAFITGYTENYGTAYNDVILLKYDRTGNLLWNTTWGSSGLDYGNSIALSSSGTVFITGFTESYGKAYSDGLLYKYDSSGNLLWDITFGKSNSFDDGTGIAIDSSGNAFIIGYTENLRGGGGCDIIILKYNYETENISLLIILIFIFSIILSGSAISVIALVIIVRKTRKKIKINY